MVNKEELEVLIPKNKELDYLNAHGMIVKRLPNGITIVGANRLVEDELSASVEISFPSGAYFDPVGKEGLLHTYEHLLAHDAGLVSQVSQGYFNAFTSIEEMKIVTNGTANPNVLDYGVWPIIPIIYSQLLEPKIPSTDRLETEKRIVLSEYYERMKSDIDRSNREFRNQRVFSSSNPINGRQETPESINSIQVKDIADLYQRFLLPEGVFVKVQTAGSPALLDKVVDDLEENLSKMPVGNKKTLVFDQEKYTEINDEIKPGEIYLFDDGRNSGVSAIELVWNYQSIPFDPGTFALSKLWEEMGGKLFKFTREAGISYSAGSGSLSSYQGFRRYINPRELYVKLPAVSNVEAVAGGLLESVRNDVLKSINDVALEDLLYRINRPIKAVPLSIGQRLYDAISGLRSTGQMIDSDKARNVFRQITKDHLKNWRDRLQQDLPIIIITGDLKDPLKQ
jgi:predicted Zn-dependent peptidase